MVLKYKPSVYHYRLMRVGGILTTVDKQEIGKRIQALRKSTGVSRKAFSRQLGYTYQWIWFMETGRRLPSIECVQRLADHFGVTVDSILKGDHHQ